MDANIESFLIELGLTALEIKVFIELMQNSGSGSVIAKRTGIHRRNVYDCLDRLLQKGLVTVVKENNVQLFSSVSPDAVLELLQQRASMFETLIPELQKKYSAGEEKREVLLYQGTAGLRLMFQDQLRVGKEILIMATTANVEEVLKYFFPSFDLKRKEKKIPVRMLVDESYRKQAKKKSLPPLLTLRYVKEFNKSPMSQYIYGDNIAVIVWGEHPSSFLIRQKDAAQGFKQSFEAMWKRGKR